MLHDEMRFIPWLHFFATGQFWKILIELSFKNLCNNRKTVNFSCP